MQYSPKLKKAIEQIKDILKEYDIAGFVVIHTPGFSEHLNYVNPSYSCAFIEGKQFRVKIKTADLPGGKEQAKQLANDTYNMVTHLSCSIAAHGIGYMEFHAMLKDKWKVEDTGGAGFTSHTQQNN